MKYQNPVVPGYFPDPSICKYKDTYYMVNSTFQYFPGVVLSESKDLVNWKQIGHVLTRQSQLPLDNAYDSGGIFAPTIRCHNGRFYMVTTNVTAFGNFYVWTDDIHGEWSEPVLVDQDGIDPSLYFEGDTCYFMSNGTDDDGVGGIVQCEIDINTGKKLTKSKCIWKGNGGRYLEGPHLYKINGTYYLLAAEGGTEYGHMIIYAKGETPYGPFENAPNNPVLTNRNLGGYEIQGCGHGDLIEDGNGNWWMVHLAFRQIDRWRMYHTTGRETYLVPVTFQKDGWFTAGENGTTRMEVETDRIPDSVKQTTSRRYTFENTTPGIEWSYLRNPDMSYYNLTKEKFSLTGNQYQLCEDKISPTFIAIRQYEMKGSVSCNVNVTNQEAGITLYMDHSLHYDFAVQKVENGYDIIKRICIGDIQKIQQSVHIDKEMAGFVTLKITFAPEVYSFQMSCNGSDYDFGQNQAKYLSTEVAEGFTGVMIGLYAQKISENCTQPAVFSNFVYEFQNLICVKTNFRKAKKSLHKLLKMAKNIDIVQLRKYNQLISKELL